MTYVKQVTDKDLLENWGFNSNSLPPRYRDTNLYVRCNKKGLIKWSDETAVMNQQDISKYDYTIIKVLDMEELLESEGVTPHPVKNKKAHKIAEKIYKKTFHLIFGLMPETSKGETALKIAKTASIEIVDQILFEVEDDIEDLYIDVKVILTSY